MSLASYRCSTPHSEYSRGWGWKARVSDGKGCLRVRNVSHSTLEMVRNYVNLASRDINERH